MAEFESSHVNDIIPNSRNSIVLVGERDSVSLVATRRALEPGYTWEQDIWGPVEIYERGGKGIAFSEGFKYVYLEGGHKPYIDQIEEDLLDRLEDEGWSEGCNTEYRDSPASSLTVRYLQLFGEVVGENEREDLKVRLYGKESFDDPTILEMRQGHDTGVHVREFDANYDDDPLVVESALQD